MPEILEAETARRLIEAAALGREIRAVRAPDRWYLKDGLTPAALGRVLLGRRLVAARRRGKLLCCDTDGGGPTLGLHLGMSGRVVIDGVAAGDPLRYAANGDRPAWVRFELRFADGGSLGLRDPRRLGSVRLDPDEGRLGIDAFALRLADLRSVLAGRRAPLKAVLMDQTAVAGLGNLLVDEVCFRAGIDPARPAAALDADEQRRLARAVRTTLAVLGRRGGSHTGDHTDARTPGGRCPRDGAEMVRRRVGGRTTWSCPRHQR